MSSKDQNDDTLLFVGIDLAARVEELGAEVKRLEQERGEAQQVAADLAKAIFDEITTASNEAMQGWMRPVIHTDDVVLAILEKKGYIETRYREYRMIYRWKQKESTNG